MAHAAKINELTAGLVSCISGWNSDTKEAKQAINEASKALRSTGHARTNQFDIKTRLSGLVEKFAVLNREDLADELQTRLDELPAQSRWLPEVLSLLLSLSDRPLEKTNLNYFGSLVELSEGPHEPTLEELFVDLSDDETGLWDDVERGYHSSGDDFSADEENLTTSTTATSVEEVDLAALAQSYITQPDESLLEPVTEFRGRLEDDDLAEVAISELVVIRETLSMLQGLPTNLYKIDASMGAVSFGQRFALQTSTRSILNDMLGRLADVGSSLRSLRSWIRADTHFLYLQACKAAGQDILSGFQSQIAGTERKYASLQDSLVVSIIDVESEVKRLAQPLILLSKLVQRAERQSTASTFALLDILYEGICVTQMSGDVLATTMLLDVFTAGLRTYLKPVSPWIQHGTLNDFDGSFFVLETCPNCDLATVWHQRFAIRKSANGQRYVPAFLEHMSERIFALGKSRAFLKTLSADVKQDATTTGAPLPDLQAPRDQASSRSLISFSQILCDTLEAWLQSVGQDCTHTLRDVILHDHGLPMTLGGMTDVCCSRNGRLFQTFADTLFWRMDAGKQWRDGFLLTELAQSTLGSGSDVSAETLSISITNEEKELPHSSVAQLEAIRLDMLFTNPIQNITRCPSPTSYSDSFTFLLQIYRIKYLLRRQTHTIRELGKRKERVSNTFAFAIRTRQLCVVLMDILHTHVTSTISVLSTELRNGMARADSIDAMASIWTEHEKQLRSSLLLLPNLRPLKDAIINTVQLCEQFCEIWNALNEDVSSEDTAQNGANSKSSQRFKYRTLSDLRNDLEKSLGFISAGARATSRASGSNALVALADRLEWCLQ